MKYSIDQLRQVKGIGKKTVQRIIEQFDEGEYVSEYNPSIHIEPNSLIQCDMLEAMNGIPDKSIDMILTDLPYGTTACSWDNVIPFNKIWKQYNRVIKEGGAIVLFGSEPFSSHLRMSNIDNYKYDWKWDKIRGVGHLNASRRPMMSIEDIMVFYNSQCQYSPQMRKRDNPRVSANNATQEVYGKSIKNFVGKTLNEKFPVNLIRFSKSSISEMGLHPTQKPVPLLEYLIKTYTSENQVVLDSTMGSGSTCVAAKKTGRKYIGIELDEEYFEIAKDRVDKIE